MKNIRSPWILVVAFSIALPATAPAAAGGAELANCFTVGEVATRSYIRPGSKNSPAGRDAQRAHVVGVAGKIRAELTPNDVERIVQKAFYEPQLNGQELGIDMAAACLQRSNFSVAPERAKVCFEVSRYTREFALQKGFSSQDRQLQIIDKRVTDPLERKLTRDLAIQVYKSRLPFEDSHKLATEFYSHCLSPEK